MLFSKLRQGLRNTKFLWLASVLCLLLVLTNSCQQPTVIEDNTYQLESLEYKPDEVNIVLIQHDSCPWAYFWCAVEQGVFDAANDFDVRVITERPDQGNYLPKRYTEEQIEILKKISDDTYKKNGAKVGVSGVGLTLITQDTGEQSTLIDLINKLRKQGIYVIIYNSRWNPKEEVNNNLEECEANENEGNSTEDKNQDEEVIDISDFIYIGQDDYLAGYDAGIKLVEKFLEKPEEKKITSSNKVKGVCINQLPGAENLEARCNGFATAIKEKGFDYAEIEAEENPDTIENKIKEQYDADTKIFLSLGPIGAAPFYNFEKQKNLDKTDYVHGIFDLSELILEGIEQEKTEFAIDQQPYLQGYLTVQWLTWMKRHNFHPYFKKEKNIFTGASFIKTDNDLEELKKQVGQYR